MYAEAYVQNDVHHQDPVELVRLLNSKAIAKLGEALDHLAAGRIPERSMAVAHASSVILELQGSLDAERGGEIAASLARLASPRALCVVTQLVRTHCRQCR